MLAKINDNAYKIYLPREYGNVITTFNISNLSLFDVGDDSRMNPFEKKGNDENMAPQEGLSKDPLYIPGGPIIRAKAKRMKEALTLLIEGIWREQAKEELQGKLLWVQDDLKYINMVCASPMQDQGRCPSDLEANWGEIGEGYCICQNCGRPVCPETQRRSASPWHRSTEP